MAESLENVAGWAIGPCKEAEAMVRKMMLAGLMAATVLGGIAPAYAQQGEGGGWRGRGNEQRAGGNAQPRSEGGRWQAGPRAPQQNTMPRPDRDGARWQQPRADRPTPSQPDGRWDRSQRPDRNANGRQAPVPVMNRPNQPDVRQDWRNDRRDGRQDWRQDRRDDRRDWRDDRRDDRQDWRQDRRDDRRDGRNGNWNDGRRFDDRTRWSSQRRWDNGWRNDRRYDWRSYRTRYGDRYRIGRYYAPRGWAYGYRRYSVGIFLSGPLYSNSYWLNDPWAYRLPPAYGTLRWIRYYDDALLVDIRDGYVVDVIHDFFW